MGNAEEKCWIVCLKDVYTVYGLFIGVWACWTKMNCLNRYEDAMEKKKKCMTIMMPNDFPFSFFSRQRHAAISTGRRR